MAIGKFFSVCFFAASASLCAQQQDFMIQKKSDSTAVNNVKEIISHTKKNFDFSKSDIFDASEIKVNAAELQRQDRNFSPVSRNFFEINSTDPSFQPSMMRSVPLTPVYQTK